MSLPLGCGVARGPSTYAIKLDLPLPTLPMTAAPRRASTAKLRREAKTGREIFFALYQAIGETGGAGIFRDYTISLGGDLAPATSVRRRTPDP
jgi:hypothetical protein